MQKSYSFHLVQRPVVVRVVQRTDLPFRLEFALITRIATGDLLADHDMRACAHQITSGLLEQIPEVVTNFELTQQGLQRNA